MPCWDKLADGRTDRQRQTKRDGQTVGQSMTTVNRSSSANDRRETTIVTYALVTKNKLCAPKFKPPPPTLSLSLLQKCNTSSTFTKSLLIPPLSLPFSLFLLQTSLRRTRTNSFVRWPASRADTRWAARWPCCAPCMRSECGTWHSPPHATHHGPIPARQMRQPSIWSTAASPYLAR